ncbi:bifunctional DNA primase/polymerase [Amycolatopsis rhizosphaerae]|uniref:bifunctional DNA primase/polymerase n=1 Tax=Amycolatopsis rhizosphaerae TaxID=2053003 RepID=UPI001643EB9E
MPNASPRSRGIASGAQVLAHLAAEAGATIPDTYTVATPSGGTHLYFRQPTNARLGNTHHRAGWLIDTRGVGWASPHPRIDHPGRGL